MRCSISGCAKESYASGLCSKHYNRKLKTGTTDDGPAARLPLADRLWRKVDRRGPNECWPWTSSAKTKGYGTLQRGARGEGTILAHRAVWEIVNGPIPDGIGYHGMVVLHSCDNRLCCNPAHLMLGTQADNVRDMDTKGRRTVSVKRGAQHPNARFTEADIRYMRSSPKSGPQLAAEYGVDRAVINTIRARRSWKHVT